MQRLPDWPERLAALIKAASGRPFFLGAWDCAHFASDACLAITGHDPLARWRGAYASEADLRALARQTECASVEAWADMAIGARVEIKRARRGDWVLAPPPDERALGVCLGALSAFVSDAGLAMKPTLPCLAAWPIGE